MNEKVESLLLDHMRRTDRRLEHIDAELGEVKGRLGGVERVAVQVCGKPPRTCAVNRKGNGGKEVAVSRLRSR